MLLPMIQVAALDTGVVQALPISRKWGVCGALHIAIEKNRDYCLVTVTSAHSVIDRIQETLLQQNCPQVNVVVSE